MGKIGARRVFVYVLLMFGIVDCYMFARITGLEQHPQIIKGLMLAMGIILCICMILWHKQNSLTETKLLYGIIAYGIIMRVGYMLYTGCDVRSHDLGSISEEGYGHAAYLLHLINGKKLPDSYRGQFYQQPFFYLTGSLISGAVNTLLQETSLYRLVDAAKLVSCFAGCMTLLVSERLCRFMNLQGKGHVIAVSLIAFLPDLYLTGGRVNCDAWNTLFFLLAFYYTCRWYKEQSWKNILSLAFIYGFGMMNKISMGIMAIFTAVVFLAMLWQEKDQKLLLKQIVKYIVFGVISLPLGLWYSIRNAILFGQSLTYVLDQASVPEIYCGNYSLVQRFVTWNLKNLFTTPYANPWDDYNYPVYLLKSSLFGEFKYEICDWIPVILLFSAVVLAILLVLACYHIIRNWKQSGLFAWLAAAFLLVYGSGMVFIQKYPYGCSMDFRYVVILGVFAAMLLGKYAETGQKKQVQTVLTSVTLVYSIFSCLMFTFIK